MSNSNIPQGAVATPVQPVYTTQPGAVVTQPVVYVQQAPVAAPKPPSLEMGYVPARLKIVSHSMLYYWWPVWVVGYLLAIMTWADGQSLQVGGREVWIHSSNNLGVAFVATLLLVILITSVAVRGLASVIVIMGMVLATVVFAYFGWWDDILAWFGNLYIYINQGAYFWFSTVMFLVWAFSTFVFDQFSYWLIMPGQVTQQYVFGASTKTYDTENMTSEKRRDDFFRHWLLGLGSGDLIINAFSAGERETLEIPNVLFVGTKIETIHKLLATKQTDENPA
jgi:hypothetical protein